MTFKEKLIENLKDHYEELFQTELRKFSVEEQKNILQEIYEIQQILDTETKKGNHDVVVFFKKDKNVKIITQCLDSEALYWEIDETDLIIKLTITVA